MVKNRKSFCLFLINNLVRANDAGDLIVTKGDQYDVRESDQTGNPVRNMGKPIEMARNYFQQGADEITFLNITSFRDIPVNDLPMLQLLKRTSESVFVPLCGIKYSD